MSGNPDAAALNKACWKHFARKAVGKYFTTCTFKTYRFSAVSRGMVVFTGKQPIRSEFFFN